MLTGLYPRLLTPPKTSFFLFGPRGTGKSTWVSRLGVARTTVDLLDEALYQRIVVDPSVFAGRLATVEKGAWSWSTRSSVFLSS